jgi:hypothetical protein
VFCPVRPAVVTSHSLSMLGTGEVNSGNAPVHVYVMAPSRAGNDIHQPNARRPPISKTCVLCTFQRLEQCRMGDSFDPFVSETPSRFLTVRTATPNPPNTLDRIYSEYQLVPRTPATIREESEDNEEDMPKENIGEVSAKKFAE